MSISITCPQCQLNYELPDELLGQLVSCSQCNTQFQVSAGLLPPVESVPVESAPNVISLGETDESPLDLATPAGHIPQNVLTPMQVNNSIPLQPLTAPHPPNLQPIQPTFQPNTAAHQATVQRSLQGEGSPCNHFDAEEEEQTNFQDQLWNWAEDHQLEAAVGMLTLITFAFGVVGATPMLASIPFAIAGFFIAISPFYPKPKKKRKKKQKDQSSPIDSTTGFQIEEAGAAAVGGGGLTGLVFLAKMATNTGRAGRAASKLTEEQVNMIGSAIPFGIGAIVVAAILYCAIQEWGVRACFLWGYLGLSILYNLYFPSIFFVSIF